MQVEMYSLFFTTVCAPPATALPPAGAAAGAATSGIATFDGLHRPNRRGGGRRAHQSSPISPGLRLACRAGGGAPEAVPRRAVRSRQRRLGGGVRSVSRRVRTPVSHGHAAVARQYEAPDGRGGARCGVLHEDAVIGSDRLGRGAAAGALQACGGAAAARRCEAHTGGAPGSSAQQHRRARARPPPAGRPRARGQRERRSAGGGATLLGGVAVHVPCGDGGVGGKHDGPRRRAQAAHRRRRLSRPAAPGVAAAAPSTLAR